MQKSKDEPILPGCSVMLEAVYHVLLQVDGRCWRECTLQIFN